MGGRALGDIGVGGLAERGLEGLEDGPLGAVAEDEGELMDEPRIVGIEVGDEVGEGEDVGGRRGRGVEASFGGVEPVEQGGLDERAQFDAEAGAGHAQAVDELGAEIEAGRGLAGARLFHSRFNQLRLKH